MLTVRAETPKKTVESTPSAASDASNTSYPVLPNGYAPLDGQAVADSGAAVVVAAEPSAPPLSPTHANRPPAVDQVDHELAIAAADAMAEVAKEQRERAEAAEQANTNTKVAKTVETILASERQKRSEEEAAKAKAERERVEREAKEAAEQRKVAEELEAKRQKELEEARKNEAVARAVAEERQRELDRHAQQNLNTPALLEEHNRRERENEDNRKIAEAAQAAATAAAQAAAASAQQAAALQAQLAESEAARKKAEADAEAAKQAAKQKNSSANNDGEPGARPNNNAGTRESSRLLISDENANNRHCLNTPAKKAAAVGSGLTLAGAIIGLVIFLTKSSSGSSDPAPSSFVLKFCANAPWPAGQRFGIYNDGDSPVGVANYDFYANAPTNGVNPWGDTNRNAVPYDAKFTSEGSGSSYHDTVKPTTTNPVNIPAKSWVFFNAQQSAADPVFAVSSATANTGNGNQAMTNTGEQCPPPQVTNTAHTTIVKQRMKQLQTQGPSSFWSNPARWLANTVLGDVVDSALAAVDPKKKRK